MLAIVKSNQGAAAPGDDRRAGISRQRILMRSAKLICSSGEYPCIVRDVSEHGVKLQLFHTPPPDMRALIELSNGELYAAEWRWSRDDTAGFEFTRPVDASAIVNERHLRARRPIRLRTEHAIRYCARGDEGNAVLVNLSARGACIETGRHLAIGSALRVEMPGWPARFASVCWRTEYRHGLVFQEELALADFARLALDLQPFAGARPVAVRHTTTPVQRLTA